MTEVCTLQASLIWDSQPLLPLPCRFDSSRGEASVRIAHQQFYWHRQYCIEKRAGKEARDPTGEDMELLGSKPYLPTNGRTNLPSRAWKDGFHKKGPARAAGALCLFISISSLWRRGCSLSQSARPRASYRQRNLSCASLGFRYRSWSFSQGFPGVIGSCFTFWG